MSGKSRRKQSVRRSLKILAVVLILTLAVPIPAFASVASLNNDTTQAGQSLAGKYPAQPVDIQFSLAEDNDGQTVTIHTNMTADQLSAAVAAKSISLSLDRDATRGYLDPKLFPYASKGGELSTWKTQGGKQLFEVKEMTAEGTDLKVTIKHICYFAPTDWSGNVVGDDADYSVPHTNGGAFFDDCGYFDLNAKVDQKAIGSAKAKVVPYNAYRTVYELYDEMAAIEKLGKSSGLYVEVKSMGNTTTDGYDMQYIIIADKKSSVDKWLAYTDEVETNPEQVLKDISAGKYTDLRVPAFISNVHSNENSAVNGILEFAKLLVETKATAGSDKIAYKTIDGYNATGKAKLEAELNARDTAIPELISGFVTKVGMLKDSDKDLTSKSIDLEKYYDVSSKTIDVDDLLGDVFFVLIPSQNVEGYQHNTRTSSEGYDPNRDEANQTLNEDANLQHLVNTYNPMVFTEIHGRVENMLIEPCTPPHEPNYEYDLIAKQFVELGEALGNGAIANNSSYNCYEMPFRDYLVKDSSSPSGVAWTEPWDDMTTAYGSQFPVLIGCAGITWEQPAYNDVSAKEVIPYGLLTQGIYIKDNKAALLTSQATLFKRGVNNENSNSEVAPWYVNQYDQTGKDADIMRPVFDGEGQNGNFYPECYIIPLDKANQKNLQDAAEDIKYLTRNDVKVNIATSEFTYDGVTYPAGTAVVTCYQAKRSIVNSQLSDGTFITNWAGLYSESFAQRSHARGYDRIIVAEPAAYKTIIAAASKVLDYEGALSYLKNFASQFDGVVDAQVIIENASEDSAAAVNALLQAGKTVSIITKGEHKGDYLCSYADYKTVDDKYILSATGVKGDSLTKSAITKSPKVYIPGAKADGTSGFIYAGTMAQSYNYMFDKHAVERMGFTVTDKLAEADVIIGASALNDEEKAAVKAGLPYMGYGFSSSSFDAIADLVPGTKFTSLSYGTDALAYVEYPNNTLVNSSYINEGDNILYEYGTGYFTAVPKSATVLVRNVNKTPLQGCIGLFDKATKAEFATYKKAVQAFEYKTDKVDIVLFANALTYKVHQRDEYGFIGNFIFSRSNQLRSDIKDTKIKASTKAVKVKGKRAIKVSWKVSGTMKSSDFAGFQVFRSAKKNSGYGTKPIYTTKKTYYTNTKNLVRGKTYYYKVRGYALEGGQKVYTAWSTKAYRTA